MTPIFRALILTLSVKPCMRVREPPKSSLVLQTYPTLWQCVDRQERQHGVVWASAKQLQACPITVTQYSYRDSILGHDHDCRKEQEDEGRWMKNPHDSRQIDFLRGRTLLHRFGEDYYDWQNFCTIQKPGSISRKRNSFSK